MNIDLNSIYKISDNLISKDIEGELVIVPLESDMGDLNAELFSLNKTGVVVWKKFDGCATIDMIIQDVANEYNMPYAKIKKEIIDLIKELLLKNLIVKA